jgi:hypothetical protein
MTPSMILQVNCLQIIVESNNKSNEKNNQYITIKEFVRWFWPG